MANSHQNGGYIDWNSGREGYLDTPRTPTYLATPKTANASKGQSGWLSISAETRLGSLIAGGGMIWIAYVASTDYAGLWRLQIAPPGPLEVCALGILVWLHAKWRRSTRPD